MPRRNLQPINSIKHYVQASTATVVSGAIGVVDVVDGAVAPAAATTSEVREGAVVKAIYLEMWMVGHGETGASTQFNYALIKLPSGLSDPTFANIQNLMAYPNKKNVFFHSQGVIGDKTTQAIPVVRQWFKIPKGKQRIGVGDKIVFAVTATGQSIQRCGFATYKEYR